MRASILKLSQYVIFISLINLFLHNTYTNLYGFTQPKSLPQELEDESKINEITIQILQTADLHGKFIPYEYANDSKNTNGSLVQIATIISNLRKQYKNTILIDTGDSIQDNYNELFHNLPLNPMILAMNTLKYDALVLGNHEFNFGLDYLNNVIATSNAKTLSANIYKPDGSRYTLPYIIKNIKGIRVGIIGLTTQYILKWDSSNLQGYSVTPPYDEAKKVVSQIQNDVDIIILATHLPPYVELGQDSAIELADQMSKFNNKIVAVLASHAHIKYNQKTNKIAVIEPANSGAYLGQILVTLTKVNNQWIVADKSNDIQSNLIPIKDVPSNKYLERILLTYHKSALREARKIIGYNREDLVKADEIEGIPRAQIEPTSLISFINEVQMYYTKADVSSAALFRYDANIKKGQIKQADAALIYTYENTLRAYKMTGKQLKKYMEWSASYYNTFKKGDLSISFNKEIRSYNYDIFSGVKYEIDISKPAGSRIVNLRRMDDTPIIDTDTLVVAMNDYRAKSSLFGNDGIFANENVPLVVDLYDEIGDKARIKSLIVDYIINVKKGKLIPKNDNNWKIIGYSWNEKDRNKLINAVKAGKITIENADNGRTLNIKSITKAQLDKI